MNIPPNAVNNKGIETKGEIKMSHKNQNKNNEEKNRRTEQNVQNNRERNSVENNNDRSKRGEEDKNRKNLDF